MYIYIYQTFHRICSSPARLWRLALVAGPYLFQRQKSSNICFKRKNHGKPLGNHWETMDLRINHLNSLLV